MKVGNQSKLQIALSEDTQFIDEVVVVGFGTQKKVNLTGAVSVINSEALEARPVTSHSSITRRFTWIKHWHE